MIEFFRSLPVPTVWAGVSFILGVGLTGVAFFLVLRRYGPLQAKVLEDLSKANDKLVETQEKTLAMMERTLHMQKEHYEEEAKEARKRHEAALAEAKAEWQTCRTALHDERKVWNADSLKMQLLIRDLESRPDMTGIKEVLAEVIGLVEKVATNLERHDKGIDERMKSFINEVKKIGRHK